MDIFPWNSSEGNRNSEDAFAARYLKPDREEAMIWRHVHRKRWNTIAAGLGGQRTAMRARNLCPDEETRINVELAARIIGFLEIASTDHVLEIGCSEGVFVREFSKRCKYVLGIDIAQEMVRVARAKSSRIENCEYKTASILKLPCEDESYDKMNCFSVIQYLDNHREVQVAFSEMSRVLKKGGLLYLGGIYFSRYGLLNIIRKQHRDPVSGSALLTFAMHVLLFSVWSPTLFYTAEQLMQLGGAVRMKTIRCSPTIDPCYTTIGTDVLFQKY